MRSGYFILSNNPLAIAERQAVEKVSGDLPAVLRLARDYVHRGHRLISYPLAGSVKPNETPYKSIILSKGQGSLDVESLMTIETAIRITEKMLLERPLPLWNQRITEDFQVIDLSLLDSALAGLSVY